MNLNNTSNKDFDDLRDNNLNEKHDFVFINYAANQFDDKKVINFLMMQLHDLAHYVVFLDTFAHHTLLTVDSLTKICKGAKFVPVGTPYVVNKGGKCDVKTCPCYTKTKNSMLNI